MAFKTLICFYLLLLCPSLLSAQESTYFLFDAQSVNFDKNETFSLNGNWQFYAGDFLNIYELDTAASIPTEVPKIWNDIDWSGKPMGAFGIATYRAQILLNKTYHELALKIPAQATAYQVYIGNKLIGNGGKAGKNTLRSIPNAKPQIISFTPQSNKIDIVFHISNFHHKRGGLREPVTLGKEAVLITQKSKKLYYDIFLIGSILIIAFYHLGNFILRQNDYSALYFAIMACCAVIRLLCTGENFIFEILPSVSWTARLNLELSSYYMLVCFGGLYSNALYPIEAKRSVIIPLVVLSIGVTMANMLAPSIFYTYLLVPYELVTLALIAYLSRGIVLIIYRKKKSAIPYSLGFLFIASTGVNDILYSNFLIDSTYLLPFGIFLFFFFQAFVLSTKTADTYQKAEQLSEELKNINRNLEAKVSQRTREIALKHQELEENTFKLKQANNDLENIKVSLELALQKESSFRKELEHTLAQLKKAQTQLVQSEKLVSLGQLTAGIAHEINNPMNFIYAGVDVLKDLITDYHFILNKYDELDRTHPTDQVQALADLASLKTEMEIETMKTEVNQLIEDINQGAIRTIEIIQGLRNFSRTDELEVSPVDLHQCIDSTLIILKGQYIDKAAITQRYDKKLPLVPCNPGQINQVLLNLLNNAIQAIDQDGEIVITTRAEKDLASISIKDSGKGIHKDLLDKIFDPFFTTKPIGEGTGLGLSISHGIIEKHGGSIQVFSQENVGTEFIIKLPYQQINRNGLN